MAKLLKRLWGDQWLINPILIVCMSLVILVPPVRWWKVALYVLFLVAITYQAVERARERRASGSEAPDE